MKGITGHEIVDEHLVPASEVTAVSHNESDTLEDREELMTTEKAMNDTPTQPR